MNVESSMHSHCHFNLCKGGSVVVSPFSLVVLVICFTCQFYPFDQFCSSFQRTCFWFHYYFLVFNFIDFYSYVYYFLPFAWTLFAPFMVFKVENQITDERTFFFSNKRFSAINFPLSIISHKVLDVLFSFKIFPFFFFSSLCDFLIVP